ncbi:hypothetical protein [Kaarinaea lacus]
MNKNLFKLVTGIILISGFSSAYAELLVNPVSKSTIGAWEGSGHLGISSAEYEVGNSSGDIDRTFFGATFAYGMNNSLDVYGTLSYTLKAELENSSTDGSGFILGGGVRVKIPVKMEVALHGYAQLLFIDEDYGGNPEVSGEETSIMAGVVASKALDNNIKLYGGLELNLYSDMDIGAFGTVSAERDDFLGFRLGANFTAGSLLWNVNTALVHENGLFISASKQF